MRVEQAAANVGRRTSVCTMGKAFVVPCPASARLAGEEAAITRQVGGALPLLHLDADGPNIPSWSSPWRCLSDADDTA